MPQEYVSSWDDAASTVIDELIDGITTDYTAAFGVAPLLERDAWLDFLPAKSNCWALFTGGGSDIAISQDDAAPASMIFESRIEGRFKTRAAARSFAMMMLKALPVYHVGNVEWFRMNANPTIEGEYKRLANDKSDALYWKTVIPCLLVFRTEEEFV